MIFRLKTFVVSVVIGAGLVLGSAVQAQVPKSFADLVEKYQPAVVNISTETEISKEAQAAPQLPPNFPFENSPFNDMFRDFFEQLPQGGVQQPMRSLGSGVIISKDGYVVTNAHVVEQADQIVVRLDGDTQEYKAEIVGRDEKTDVALLKLPDDRSWPYAKLGDSDKVRVGDWVIAVGNPFGLGGTVTSGIISARGRNINVGPYDDFLQTDAAINPGNSGGPLFSVDGDVIGINTAILTRSGGSQGIGFAIPANTVKLLVDQLKEHGHAIRGWLGVRIQAITPELGEAFGLKHNEGALVASIVPNSPAVKAGVVEGDVIVAFDGKNIGEMNELPRLVAQTPVGKTVDIEIIRNNKRKVLKTKIEQLDEDEAPQKSTYTENKSTLGMKLSELNNSLRQQLALSDEMEGVAILNVVPNSIAAKAGLRRGDVVLEANRKKVKTVDALKDVFADTKGKTVLILVHRSGSNLFVAVRNES